MGCRERGNIRRKSRERGRRRMGRRTGEKSIGNEDYDAPDLPVTKGASLNSHYKQRIKAVLSGAHASHQKVA